MTSDITCDLAIIGGGLAGGLTAYALSIVRPELDIRLIDPGATFGGNHVWSFFDTDIAAADRWIVEPFVDHSWGGYEVRFPAFRRRLPNRYNSIRSQNYDAKLRALLPGAVALQAEAVQVGPTSAYLADQRRVVAAGVLDARGGGDLSQLDYGWQKFVGQELRTTAPHGLTEPIVMDASVPQLDGYRFVYALPFAADRVFVEDTYYSDGPDIDAELLRARIAEYAAAQGWQVAEVMHEEIGALPVTKGGDFEGFWRADGDAAKLGARAGLFHPTTGFSLPDAVRTASLIARTPDLSGAAIKAVLHDFAAARWASGGFYRLLDRMLFGAAEPHERYRVLERFYRLRPALIARFYAGDTKWLDKARILAGKPPVPIGRALRVLREKRS